MSSTPATVPPARSRAVAPGGWPLVLGGWGLLVALALTLRPILPVDETRYLAVAWEMWLRGDFLVPHLNGVPYSDKPPLLFWLIHLGWRAFGVDAVWPRLVPALFALGNLGLAAALARRLWPERPEVGRAAPVMLSGLLLWSLFTTFVMFDMLVTCFVLLALAGILTARERPWGWLLAGLALGGGILAKGPVVLLAPLFVAALGPWWAGDRPRGGWGRWYAGALGAVALAAAVGLAWALPAAAAGGERYGQAILLTQTEERIVRSFAHRRPWWWYLPVLPLLLFPYSLWPPAWAAARRLRLRSADPGTRFCLAWALPALAAFSLISGKQPHYLLPLVPAFALLVARGVSADSPGKPWHALLPVAGPVLAGAAVALVPLLAGHPGMPPWLPLVPAWVGSVLVLSSLGLALLIDRFPARRHLVLSLVSVVLLAALHLGFAPVARQDYDPRPIARYLRRLEEQGRPIAYMGQYHGEFHFAGRLRRPFAEITPREVGAWMAEHPEGKVVAPEHQLPPNRTVFDFTHPYRDGFVAIWGREPPRPVPSG